MARTASEIQADLSVWYAARTAIAQGQAYKIGDMDVSRAHIKHVNLTIQQLERDLARAQRGPRGPMPTFGSGR